MGYRVVSPRIQLPYDDGPSDTYDLYYITKYKTQHYLSISGNYKKKIHFENAIKNLFCTCTVLVELFTLKYK